MVPILAGFIAYGLIRAPQFFQRARLQRHPLGDPIGVRFAPGDLEKFVVTASAASGWPAAIFTW